MNAPLLFRFRTVGIKLVDRFVPCPLTLKERDSQRESQQDPQSPTKEGVSLEWG
jgi:hypothetical protein